MALYYDTTCDDCGQNKSLLVAGVVEGEGGRPDEDVVAFCIQCLRRTHSAEEVLDMIERGKME